MNVLKITAVEAALTKGPVTPAIVTDAINEVIDGLKGKAQLMSDTSILQTEINNLGIINVAAAKLAAEEIEE